MTPLEQRRKIVMCIQEAVDNGAALKKACEIISLEPRTFQRWKKTEDGDKRPFAPKNNPKKLTESEKKQILNVCNLPEYRDKTPNIIVPMLAEKGSYIASESMFYRVLRENKQLKHRGESKQPTPSVRPPTLIATGSNQVWSWDITYLKTDLRGIFLYLYLFMDVWSRKIVGWTIEKIESGEIAADTLEKLCIQNQIQQVWLHSDNGSPMKCGTMLARMEALGVLPSFSRPAVSNDNPFSESLFKTVKYRPGYPGAFSSKESADIWMEGFVNWYNNEHHHSGIKFVTPNERHSGLDIAILEERKKTYEKAYQQNPQRWAGKLKNFDHQKIVVLNGKVEKKKIKKIA